FPRRLGTGRIRHPEGDAGDDLHREGECDRMAPNITPARAARYIHKKRFVGQSANTGAMVQPVEEFLHAGIFSRTPAWKFWNVTQISSLRISTGSESIRRGAGLRGSLI